MTLSKDFQVKPEMTLLDRFMLYDRYVIGQIKLFICKIAKSKYKTTLLLID